MNTTNIKIISCDLDGTLLNGHGQLSDYSISVLLDLQKKGYCLILNSGRFYHELVEFIKPLSLDLYGGYVICSNGYILYDCKKGTFHSFDAISNKECKSLLQLAKKAHVLTFYYTNQTYYICASYFFVVLQYVVKAIIKLCQPFLANYLRKYISMLMKTKFHSFAQTSSFDHVEKLCFIQFPFLLRRLRKSILASEQGYRFFDVNSFSIELVKENVSKADAISYLCKEKGYTLSQVIAFGDAGNDIPLLTQAGIGVLMKNAHKHMKQYSNIQTEEDNLHDGVAKFLVKHLSS